MAPPKKILIVGGGSSGWMTAIALSRMPGLEVSLIESSDIPIIGVGESTNRTMQRFLRLMGIDELEFMRASNAAFKIGIRFQDFSRVGESFLHPFGTGRISESKLFKGQTQRLFISYHQSELGNKFSREIAYSYQLDAGLFAQFLKVDCRKNGVRHIIDDVREVVLSDKGEIASIETRKSGPLTADIYVDCTGFRSLLLAKALKEPFRPSNKHLLNDRAVATRMPYVDKDKELKTYTNCTGLSSGWVWNIPLWSRIGTGYVYSSAFLSKSAAEEELRKHLGEERVKDLEFRDIEIRCGRHDRAWVGNCVGVGISYGFLEPLESTGLSLTTVGIFDLAHALVAPEGRAVVQALYNKRQAEIFDSTRDFILAHFVLSKRDDTPYWKYINKENPITDSLAEILSYAERHSYFPLKDKTHLFYQEANWNLILSGMGFFDQNGELKAKFKLPPSEVHAQFLAKEVYGKDYAEPKPTMPEIDKYPKWAPLWAATD